MQVILWEIRANTRYPVSGTLLSKKDNTRKDHAPCQKIDFEIFYLSQAFDFSLYP